MSYKDKLKKAQGGSEIPKLDVSMRLTAKAKDGKPGFVYMADVEGQGRVEKHQNFAIKGVLVGTGMVLNCFSKDLGPKGGSFHSSVYFRKTDTIALFGPTAGGVKRMMAGNLDQVEDFLTKKRREITSLDKTKKQMVMYIATEKNGLVEIRTNLTLGFDVLKSLKRGSTLEYLISITAAIYDPKDRSISDNAKKILGTLADKNPPCYCKVAVTDIPLTDEFAEKSGLERHLDDFEVFKQFSANADSQEYAGDDEETAEEPVSNGGSNSDLPESSDGDDDELPF